MLEAQRSIKGFKISIFELCAIVTANYSYEILRELILNQRIKSRKCDKASTLPSMKNTQP
jgi:hypothetical protein